MTFAEEIKQQVLREIASEPTRSGATGGSHGLNLDRCLLGTPVRKVCTHTFRNNERVPMWVVLREDTAEQPGYSVVFDESAGQFGLATGDAEHLVFIGFYGSFLETLESM